MRLLLFSLLCLLLLAPPALRAQTIRHVGSGQTYPTIQSGIDAASPGDTVLISPGTYFEHIDFHGKAITVTTSGGPAVTILDGSQTAPAVTFSSGETRAAILSGLTIQHGGHFGNANLPVGGVVIYASAPSIQGNVLTQNDCWTIYTTASAPLIQDNQINSTQDPDGQCSFGGGAGIFINSNRNFSTAINDGNSPLIIGNTIDNNVESGTEDAGGNGGAAIAVWGGSPIIMNNILRNNASPGGTGGAINVEDGAGVSIVQNIIYGNSASCGGGALAVEANPDPRTGIAALIANNTIARDVGMGPGGFSNCVDISEIYPDPGGYGFSSPATIFLNNVISASTPYQAAYCGSFNLPNVSFQPDYASNILYNSDGPFFNSICVDVTSLNGNLPLDPQFLDPATFDLHLQPTSPAIGHGDPSVLTTFHTLTGLTLSTDFDGNPRQSSNGSTCTIDMGAYQHAGSGPACGALLALTASPNPSIFGQTVTFTAQLSGTSNAPTGDIQFTDGTTVLATVTVSAAGAATFSTSLLSVGSHVIIATYQPVGNASGTQASVTEVVTGAPTATTLTSSLNPATIGQSVPFTALVASGGGSPTGTITFADGATTLATIPAVSGTATYAITTLAVGTHSITATFNPSGTFAGSSGSLTEVINGRPTATGLSATPNPVAAFGALTLTGTVSTSSGTPSGTVLFTANGTTLGRAPLNASGQAILTVAAPSPGTYSLVATYSGDATFQSTASAVFTETVLSAAGSTSLTTSPDPAYQGQPVNLTATVPGTAGHTPTGSVSFFDGTISLGSATLAGSGNAVLITSSLAPGTHTLTATYPGDGTFSPSASSPVQQIILPAAFSIALTPSTLTLHSGQPGTVLILLTTTGNFSGPLTLAVGALPTYASATVTPISVTLPAGGSAAASLALTTAMAPQLAHSRGPTRPAAFLAALFGLLLLPRSRLRLRLGGRLALLLLAAGIGVSGGCGGDIRYPFNAVAAGTYTIPVTATDISQNTHTATLTLVVIP